MTDFHEKRRFRVLRTTSDQANVDIVLDTFMADRHVALYDIASSPRVRRTSGYRTVFSAR